MTTARLTALHDSGRNALASEAGRASEGGSGNRRGGGVRFHMSRIGMAMRTKTRAPELRYAWTPAAVLAVMMSFAALNGINGQGAFSYQERYNRGQNIAPSFEGWEENTDGTFDIVFGYFNRNWEEQLDIPIGPSNNIEPGGPDQGQPTHFFPRRNRFVFRIKVSKDFGRKELVWTLTVHGKTEKAYATLKPEYALEGNILMRNTSGGSPPGVNDNKAPVVRVDANTQRSVKVGQPLILTGYASDDGIPKPRSVPRPRGEPGYSSAWGLRVAWFVYRGPADQVRFDPEQFRVYPDYKKASPWKPGWNTPPLPADGKFPVTATFNAPGTFVLRVLAHDGGLSSAQDVTVTVNP